MAMDMWTNPVTVVKLPRGLKKKKGKRELPSTEELKIVSSHSNGFDLLPLFSSLKQDAGKSEAGTYNKEKILTLKKDN